MMNLQHDSITIATEQESPIFKLADCMRSMQTNGASKNRDWQGQNG